MVDDEAPDDQTNVVPARLSKPGATRIIKELGANADNIIPLSHCIKRMKKRKLSITQIRRVVQAGFIDGDPWFDMEHGNWRVTMRSFSAGVNITIGVAIDWKTQLLVVTIF